MEFYGIRWGGTLAQLSQFRFWRKFPRSIVSAQCPFGEPAFNSALVEQRGRIFRNAERLNRFFSFSFLWIDLNDRRTLHLRKQRLGGVGCFKHWLERGLFWCLLNVFFLES